MPYDPNSPAARMGMEYDEATSTYHWPRGRVPADLFGLGASSRSHHSRTEQDLAALKATPAAIAAAWKDYRAEVAAANSPQAHARYLPAVIQAKLQEARTKVDATLAQIEQDSRAAHERLAAAAEHAKGKASSSYDGGATRAAWERARLVLERCSSDERDQRLQQLIADAGRQGDVATLRALQVELPSYLEAQESPTMRTNRVVAHKTFAEGSAALQRMLADVAKASVPHLSAEERAAYEITEAVKPAEWAIAPNLTTVRQALRDGSSRVPHLFGWEQKSLVEVDGTPTQQQLAEERAQRLAEYQQQQMLNRPTHQQQLRQQAMREMRQAPDGAPARDE